MSGSIKLKHASGNGVIIAAPSSNPAADRTITLPSTADGTMLTTTNPKSGSIIQVVNTNLTGTSSVSVPDGSLADTPLTVDITSTMANSKFIISGTLNGEGGAADHTIGIIMRRVIGGSGTSINIGDTEGNRTSVSCLHSVGSYVNDNISTPATSSFSPYVDSPSQASGTTITYKYALIGVGVTFTYFFGRPAGDSNSSGYERMPNHITVMEVAP